MKIGDPVVFNIGIERKAALGIIIDFYHEVGNDEPSFVIARITGPPTLHRVIYHRVQSRIKMAPELTDAENAAYHAYLLGVTP